MPRVAVSVPTNNAFINGKCVGFQQTRGNDYLRAQFRASDGEVYTKLLNIPVRLKDINEIRIACGMTALTSAIDIDLPDYGATDMLGYDTELTFFAEVKDGHLNASRFKAIGSNGNHVTPGNSGDDDLPF